MANVIINDTNLTNIAAAIREKNGTTTTYKPSEMASAIAAIETGGGGGSAELPSEAFDFSGDCSYAFAGGHFDWFISNYGSKITTSAITNANYMFKNAKTIEEIPFDINFNNDSYRIATYMFQNCQNLKSITGKIVDLYPTSMASMFYNCYNLRYLPEFSNLYMNRIQTNTSGSVSSMFNGCYSLRSIPESLLKKLYNPTTASTTYRVTTNFNNLYVLDELVGLNPTSNVAITSNTFSSAFKYFSRVKDIKFATQDSGLPISVSWKNQTIDLTSYVGYASVDTHITNYNSGITKAKKVTDDATYVALKDDPDWYTASVNYSRYNHDSAVNTINSLPETSSTGCTIKFKGAAGTNTDGGAINTLTEEEIAVATAKGWTVTLV